MGLRDYCRDFKAGFRGDRLQIMARDIEAFRSLQGSLPRPHVALHTFTLSQEAELKVALQGLHHSTDVRVILDEFKAMGFQATYPELLPRNGGESRVPTNTFFVKISRVG